MRHLSSRFHVPSPSGALRMLRRCSFLGALLACDSGSQGVSPAPPPVPVGPVAAQIDAIIQRDEDAWIALRRDLHRHPEVSGDERRTAQVVATEMRKLGLEVRTGVGGHGVVAILRGRRPGPMVAYRADMDAVLSSAPDPVDFRSVNDGVRHICGHDIHTTVAMGLATALHQVRDSLAGSVMFVFQPAEERATGAVAMLNDGVFGAAPPVAIYGVHTAPYEAGRLATTAGPMMAGRDRFELTLSGTTALSEAANLATQRLLALSTITAAQIGTPQPPDFVLMQVGAPQLDGGTARIQGSVIVASAAARRRVRDAITRGIEAAMPAGTRVNATYTEKAIAGVTNDSALATTAMAAVRSSLGAANLATVTSIPPAFSEDFGSFQDIVPGVLFYLGVANSQRGWSGLPHSGDYVADERAIATGVRAMAAVVLSHLTR